MKNTKEFIEMVQLISLILKLDVERLEVVKVKIDERIKELRYK